MVLIIVVEAVEDVGVRRVPNEEDVDVDEEGVKLLLRLIELENCGCNGDVITSALCGLSESGEFEFKFTEVEEFNNGIDDTIIEGGWLEDSILA